MVTQPASLLRVIGVGIIALLTAEMVLSSINWMHHQQAFDAIFLYLIIAWPVTAFGEWLWSFEGEWFALQRMFRIIQITTLVASFLVPISVSLWMKYFPPWF